MTYRLYAIKDELVGFNSPMVEQNEQSAIRNFTFAIQKEGTLLHENKKDYTLYFLGTYDSEKGVIEPVTPEVVINGSSIL